MFKLHNVLGFAFAIVVAAIVLTGWVPPTTPRAAVPESVRANPGSYRPIYVPLYRGGGGGGGSGGGWSGGK